MKAEFGWLQRNCEAGEQLAVAKSRRHRELAIELLLSCKASITVAVERCNHDYDRSQMRRVSAADQMFVKCT